MINVKPGLTEAKYYPIIYVHHLSLRIYLKYPCIYLIVNFMEKENLLSRRDFIKNVAVSTAGAVGATLASGPITTGIEAMVKDNSEPELPFVPTMPLRDSDADIPRHPILKPENPLQERQEQIAREMVKIEKIMEANPNVFSRKKIRDFSMYYPIYRPIADKFQIDWYLIFIVHEAETGASAGKKGFSDESYYKGAMQLDPEYWDQEYIKKASKGLSYLANLPQRHADDWMNIAAGAKILADNFHQNKNLTKDRAVLFALRRYSSREQADKRFETYKRFDKLFAPKKRNEVTKRPLMLAS